MQRSERRKEKTLLSHNRKLVLWRAKGLTIPSTQQRSGGLSWRSVMKTTFILYLWVLQSLTHMQLPSPPPTPTSGCLWLVLISLKRVSVSSGKIRPIRQARQHPRADMAFPSTYSESQFLKMLGEKLSKSCGKLQTLSSLKIYKSLHLHFLNQFDLGTCLLSGIYIPGILCVTEHLLESIEFMHLKS